MSGELKCHQVTTVSKVTTRGTLEWFRGQVVFCNYYHLLIIWQHTLEADERDDPVAPTSGYVGRLTQELAGLGGDVFFGKVDLHMQVFRELFWNWVSLAA